MEPQAPRARPWPGRSGLGLTDRARQCRPGSVAVFFAMAPSHVSGTLISVWSLDQPWRFQEESSPRGQLECTCQTWQVADKPLILSLVWGWQL